MAMSGYGYWAIVSTSITIPLMSTAGLWLATRWIPGRPHRNIGIGSFVHFGGTMTVTGFVSYFGFNIDKLLLGRFWGAEVMGIYGRAYHLIMMPIDNLNASVGDVAFAALSRTGTDPVRAKRYFLKGYSLIVALTLPLTLTCALFADELIAVLLGPKWEQAAEILRILAPMILVFAIANPLGWLLNSRGMVKRNLQIALISAPLMIIGVVVALPYGAKGVAVAFSTVMLLKLVPITAFALIGTGIRISEIFVALVQPLAACLAAAAIVFAIRSFYAPVLPLVLKLGVDVGLFGSLYLCILLCISGRQSIYIDLLRETKAIAAR
jgi:PST family polysaccharide transporter